MLTRSIIGFSLVIFGIALAVFITQFDNDEKESISDQALTKIQNNIKSLSLNLSVLSDSIHENDSKRAFEKISKAKSITDSTQVKLNEVKGRIEQVPHRTSSGGIFGGGIGIVWDKGGALNAIASLESDLNRARNLITDASLTISSVSTQMISIDRRVSAIDQSMKKEISNFSNITSSNAASNIPTINFWLTIFVSIMGIFGGLSTIILGWRKDRREYIELKDKLIRSDAN